MKYTITDTKTGNKITVTTDDNGIALYTPLKFDTYTITEDLSGVSGYTPLTSPEKITTESANPDWVLRMRRGIRLRWIAV